MKIVNGAIIAQNKLRISKSKQLNKLNLPIKIETESILGSIYNRDVMPLTPIKIKMLPK